MTDLTVDMASEAREAQDVGERHRLDQEVDRARQAVVARRGTCWSSCPASGTPCLAAQESPLLRVVRRRRTWSRTPLVLRRKRAMGTLTPAAAANA